MGIIVKTSSAAKILEQWGLWARTDRGPAGYKSQILAIMVDNVEQRKVTRTPRWITDDQGAAIDAALCHLGTVNWMTARCLWLHYFKGWCFIDIAEELNCSRNMVSGLHGDGIMWLDGYCAGIEELLKIA